MKTLKKHSSYPSSFKAQERTGGLRDFLWIPDNSVWIETCSYIYIYIKWLMIQYESKHVAIYIMPDDSVWIETCSYIYVCMCTRKF
jgi:hypothetical protein